MARQKRINPLAASPTAKTTEVQPAQPQKRAGRNPDDPVENLGVALRRSEKEALDAIGAELGVSRNALLAWSARYVISEYKAGRMQALRKAVKPRAMLSMDF